MFQSTPVIADGRAGHGAMNHAFTLRFQSTPVIADGRAAATNWRSHDMNLFQSTPVIADGRAKWSSAPSYCSAKFQSTPVIADGRAVIFWTAPGPSRCFNPRPSSLTGEPLDDEPPPQAKAVSIHARHR